MSDEFNLQQVENLKKLLPCMGDRKQIDSHEDRIRKLEDICLRLDIIISGEQGLKQIAYQLKEIREFLNKHEADIMSISDLRKRVDNMTFFSSGAFKLILVLVGAVGGVILKMLFLK